MAKNKLKGTRIELREDEDINRALRRFKNKVSDAGTLEDLKKKEFYEKPTTKKKRRAGAAKSRWKKHLQREQLPQKYY